MGQGLLMWKDAMIISITVVIPPCSGLGPWLLAIGNSVFTLYSRFLAGRFREAGAGVSAR